MSRIEKALEKAAKLRMNHDTSVMCDEHNNVMHTNNKVSTFPEASKSLKLSNYLLTPFTDPHSPVSEEYRKLKSVLLKMTKSDDFSNTIMVTSALPGEGKTVTAINLAITLAMEHDYTVLLVDADLRRPSVHLYLGIEPKYGLSDCLVREVSVADVLINTGVGKLMVLPAGDAVPNPVELFSSQRMLQLFKEIKHRYTDRFVVIDVPPVVPFAEVRQLAHHVDGVLYVVKERLSPIESVVEGLEALGDANVVGVVYNEAEVTSGKSSYYYRYPGQK